MKHLFLTLFLTFAELSSSHASTRLNKTANPFKPSIKTLFNENFVSHKGEEVQGDVNSFQPYTNEYIPRSEFPENEFQEESLQQIAIPDGYVHGPYYEAPPIADETTALENVQSYDSTSSSDQFDEYSGVSNLQSIYNVSSDDSVYYEENPDYYKDTPEYYECNPEYYRETPECYQGDPYYYGETVNEYSQDVQPLEETPLEMVDPTYSAVQVAPTYIEDGSQSFLSHEDGSQSLLSHEDAQVLTPYTQPQVMSMETPRMTEPYSVVGQPIEPDESTLVATQPEYDTFSSGYEISPVPYTPSTLVAKPLVTSQAMPTYSTTVPVCDFTISGKFIQSETNPVFFVEKCSYSASPVVEAIPLFTEPYYQSTPSYDQYYISQASPLISEIQPSYH